MALKGINAYRKGNLKQDIASADPHKLTLMLLQGALDRIAYAKGAMERKDLITKADFISKTSAILMHLRDTLDLEIGGEVAQNMFNLYDYMIQRLNDAHVNNDLKLLDEVSSLLTPIRDAWVQIPETAKQEAFEAQRQNRQAM
ncbi:MULTISPECIES: flagellar export chaperone FliS [Alteromonas]|jgi:flagellar protein FliS|uniref:Flagellar secretion chaperone FliS n=2 Tax=Alteromonas TaxID=226 RepID=A0AAW7Z895_9ALTE|nr:MULTISPECIES: flagellar export chaperone FliS [Alteromonas]AMJ90760.1 flagellar protein FliS [Alteromonas sp. Mac2]PHS59534.1 MAG: flagellar export chaperone FliS [Alteromonas sp.]AEF04202.1 flagellar protein FliS [Alteromonas naphthalenivorans]ALM91494.1 Flagellar biosynthesis protein FliS [Alteromonas stellipolaris LMG 21856]AMJ74466.1 flagellar protein FliS [Alteromonas stellipolaris]|tara:strand:+ start:192 stop:620 length:429 start_codon:yes stop_codon:yes gene_type:complete|mmetsp:Transcript_12900/g.33026  ORF Transcript_12900/g.33026 Transcript_12900/m.33026 type:complete len:143 (-) Transcript_12900:732-1160(-)